MSFRSLLSPTALSCLLVLTACSPDGSGGGTTPPSSGDAGPTGSDPTGSDPTGSGGDGSGGDGSGGDGSGGDGSGGDGSGNEFGDGGATTADAGPTDTDAGMLEEGTDAHVDDSCDLSTFAGFMITVFENVTTCDERFISGGDFVQFLVGEPTGVPQPEGRTYTVVTETEDIFGYPADGEATASYSGHASGSDSASVVSGTITVVADSSVKFSGSYDVMLSDDRHLTKTFTSDRCPQQPGDCD